MEAILNVFGIDWRLLLLQGINFGLLLTALTYFLYTPVLRMLEERRQKVADGVRAAESAKQELQEIERSRAEILEKAAAEADQVLVHARSAAAKKERELIQAGEAASAALLKEADLQAHELKTQAIEQSKREVAKLIVLGMEKLKS